MTGGWKIWRASPEGNLISPIREWTPQSRTLEANCDRCPPGTIGADCTCGIYYVTNPWILTGSFFGVQEPVITFGTVGDQSFPDLDLLGLFGNRTRRTNTYSITGMIAPARYQSALTARYSVPVIPGLADSLNFMKLAGTV